MAAGGYMDVDDGEGEMRVRVALIFPRVTPLLARKQTRERSRAHAPGHVHGHMYLYGIMVKTIIKSE